MRSLYSRSTQEARFRYRCKAESQIKALLGSAEVPRSERDVPLAPKAFAGPLRPAPAAPLPATVIESIVNLAPSCSQQILQ